MTPPSEKRCGGSGTISYHRDDGRGPEFNNAPDSTAGGGFFSCPGCPDCQPSRDAPLIDTNKHASPEADEQVGGEQRVIVDTWDDDQPTYRLAAACSTCGWEGQYERQKGYGPRVRVECPECECRTVRTSPLLPASSSIPTEKVRGVVERMRAEAVSLERTLLPNLAGDRKRVEVLRLRTWADRLSALVEGTEE